MKMNRTKTGLCAFFLLLAFGITGSYSLASDQGAAHDLLVEALIPDLIEISGLPDRIDLQWNDGELAYDSIDFSVHRSSASNLNPLPYAITISSSEGQEGQKYYLTHSNDSKERLYINAMFKSREESRFSQHFSDGRRLYGTTVTNIDQQTHLEANGASIRLYNDDSSYLYSKIPGMYRTTLTITVTAV